MARIQYSSLVTEIRGAVGGNIFSNTAAGATVRSRRVGSQPNSKLQTQTISNNFSAIKSWQLLSLTQKEAWGAFAAAHNRINMFGQVKHLSGFQMYLFVANNRVLCGQTPFPDPPTYAMPDAITDLVLSNDSGSLVCAIDPAPTPAYTYTVLYTTPPTNSPNSTQQSAFRLTKVFEPGISGDQDITAEWKAAHNLNFPPSTYAVYQIAGIAYPILSTSGWSIAGIKSIFSLG